MTDRSALDVELWEQGNSEALLLPKSHCWTFSRSQYNDPSITFLCSVLSHLHFLPCWHRCGDPPSQTQSTNTLNNLFFFSLAPSGQNPQPWINLTSAFCAPNPGYCAPWEGREKNHVTAWLGHCKVRISHLHWDLNAALKIHLYHCFFLFSATAVSNLYHFLQVYDLITASLTFSRQSGEKARLPLLSPLLTKISAAHTRALPSPPATWTEGVPFHLCSGSLLRLLWYKLFLFSPTSSNYFFCWFFPISIKIFASIPGLNSTSSQSLLLSPCSHKQTLEEM